MSPRRGASASVLGLLLASAAAAEPGALRTGTSVEGLRALMMEWGLPTAVTALEDGTPVLDSEVGGQVFSVLFYNCADATDAATDTAAGEAVCRDIQFRAAFTRTAPPTLAAVNAWNRDMRFSRAYLFADRYAYLEMDLRLDGGLTEQTLAAAADTFVRQMAGFAAHLDR